MFGRNASTAGKSMAGGIVMTLLQGLIARRVAGRVAGVAARGGGGIPGLILWMVASHFLNKYMNRGKATPPAGTPRVPARR